MASAVVTLPEIADDVLVLLELTGAGVGGGVFPARYFPKRYFTGRYFPTGVAPAPPASDTAKTVMIRYWFALRRN